MIKFKCPSCGNKTISIYKKAFLDPRNKKECTECGCLYTAAPFGFIASFAFVLGFYMVLKYIKQIEYKVLLSIMDMILYALINIFLVPIVKKED